MDDDALSFDDLIEANNGQNSVEKTCKQCEDLKKVKSLPKNFILKNHTPLKMKPSRKAIGLMPIELVDEPILIDKVVDILDKILIQSKFKQTFDQKYPSQKKIVQDQDPDSHDNEILFSNSPKSSVV